MLALLNIKDGVTRDPIKSNRLDVLLTGLLFQPILSYYTMIPCHIKQDQYL